MTTIRYGLLAAVGLLAAAVQTEDNTLLLIDGSSTNASVIVGVGGTNNLLVVTNRGHLVAQEVVIGYGNGADRNRAVVTGQGAVLEVGELMIGTNGRGNEVVVTNGGRLATRSVVVGLNSDSSVLAISGTESTWSDTGRVSVGPGSTKCRVTVTDGAEADFQSLEVRGGEFNGIEVVGPDAVLRAARLEIGHYSGRHWLAVGKGGSLYVDDLRLGWFSYGIPNELTVADSGSKVVVEGEFSVAAGSRVRIEEGARLITKSAGVFLRDTWIQIAGEGTIWQGESLRSTEQSYQTNGFTVAQGARLSFTNAQGTGSISLGRAGLHLAGGTIEADRIEFALVDPSQIPLISDFTFSRGVVIARDMTIDKGFGEFVVGDGLGAAVLSVRGGVLEVRGRRLVISPGATITGVGVLSAPANPSTNVALPVVNEGVLAPGRPYGVLQCEGSLRNDGRIELELNGVEFGTDHDVIAVSGQVELGGALLLGGGPMFRPHWTNEFVVMRWGSVAGAFTNALPGGRAFVRGGGTVRVHYRPDALVLSDFQKDSDGDGVDDLWATTWFGHTPLSEAERVADSDGDGMSNEAEAVAGTDPTDRERVFRVLGIQSEGGLVRLRFTHVPGKWYRIWRARTPGEWAGVPSPQFTYPAPGEAEWAESASTSGLAEFFRVSVQ
ncbi:MAG: thrombospondin type 3 repeat-containing protein [Limisphaerales bacterium]